MYLKAVVDSRPAPGISIHYDEIDVLNYCEGLAESMQIVPPRKAHYLPTRDSEKLCPEFLTESFKEAENILSILIFPCKIRRLRIEPFGKYPHAHYEFRFNSYRLYQVPQPRHQHWLHRPR